jgi:hypothetical protein
MSYTLHTNSPYLTVTIAPYLSEAEVDRPYVEDFEIIEVIARGKTFGLDFLKKMSKRHAKKLWFFVDEFVCKDHDRIMRDIKYDAYADKCERMANA